MSQTQEPEKLMWFTRPHKQAICLVRDADKLDALVTSIVKGARACNLHIVIINATELATSAALALQLENLYEFPIRAHDKHIPKVRWDGIRDWLTDLTWISESNKPDLQPVKGFVLFFLNPSALYVVDPVEMAFFLDVVADAACEHAKINLPFHMIIGPVQHELEQFLRVLRVHEFIDYKNCTEQIFTAPSL